MHINDLLSYKEMEVINAIWQGRKLRHRDRGDLFKIKQLVSSKVRDESRSVWDHIKVFSSVLFSFGVRAGVWERANRNLLSSQFC